MLRQPLGSPSPLGGGEVKGDGAATLSSQIPDSRNRARRIMIIVIRPLNPNPSPAEGRGGPEDWRLHGKASFLAA